MSRSTHDSHSAYDANAGGTPARGSSASTGARFEAIPVSSPAYHGEFAESARTTGSHGTIASRQRQQSSGEGIPTTLNASALRDSDGKVIGAIGILRDMREYEEVVRDLEQSKGELQEKILDLEKFEEVVVGRELKMIALEKELESLQREVERHRAESGRI